MPYNNSCFPGSILELNFSYDFLTHILPAPYLTYWPTAPLSKIMGPQFLAPCRIIYVSDVSEERVASTFRETEFGSDQSL